MQPTKSINILIAEDDDDHYFLVEKFFKKSRSTAQLHRVLDGEDLMDALFKRGRFKGSGALPDPDLILLDLNMPRKDGWEALREIKGDPGLRRIPVVVVTTSDNEEDKIRSYDLGANSFIRKPTELKKWMETIQTLMRYWFEVNA